MRMNRLSAGLLFAFGCALAACGGADQGVDDSLESLRRGQAADGGSSRVRDGGPSRGGHDKDDDTDEAADEALEGDGGKSHDHARDHVDGDGGCRGDNDDDVDDEDDEADEAQGGKGGKGGKGERDGGKRGFPFAFDAGTP
jgi:hypothetical protein